MKKFIAPVILITIILFSEIFSYIAIRRLFNKNQKQLKKFNWIWWSIVVLLYTVLFLTRKYSGNYTRNIVVNVFMMILIAKLVLGLSYLITIGLQAIRRKQEESAVQKEGRREFAAKLALGTAAIPLGLMNWGVFRTAYHFKVHRPVFRFPNLPAAFSGIKIIQLSDIHTGSLQTRHQLQKAVDMVMEEQADLIVFTGDLVNNRTDEVYPYMDVLEQLKAPMGVYSVLGNHDYGEYETWPDEQSKRENMEEMYRVHKQLGWKLMLNEHVIFEKDGEQLALIGVENWGANLHFKKYGRLDLAYKGTEAVPFKLLLSHDPSHFDTEVTEQYKDIDLTLSGHTHGFQFGIEIPGYFRWSPAQYIYKQWAGIYRKGKQYVYVNRGLGCLGYMGRVGIQPEITVLELRTE